MNLSGPEATPLSSDEDAEEIRVLAVDDDAGFVELTAESLQREDDRFTVLTETSASDALDRLGSDGIDCVVSDYEMPPMDGVEFLRSVREDYGDVPFILFTGRGSEEIASEAIYADVTDYLQKRRDPSQYELLANRITNAVEQARARRRADEHHRVSTVIRKINRALVEATSREEISHRVCDILTDAEPYVFAWIGGIDPETGRIEPQAAAGLEAGYLDEITVTVDESQTGRGPGGRAVRENRVAVTQNITDDESFDPWREKARERGYRAVAAIPLAYDDTQYGILGVYADRTGAFDEAERTLLAELGDTIAHACHRLDIQAQREDQYRVLFEDAPVMFALTREVDGEPVIEDCNRLFAETLGYDRDELRGSPLAEWYTDESREMLLDQGGYDRALASEFVPEQRSLVTSDGDVVETLLQATPRRDTDGELVGTHALFVDVTDQTQIQTLQALHERLEFALEATDSILFDVDLDTGEETRHGPFERLYGIPSDRVPTSEAFYEECVHPDDRERLRELQRPEALAEADGTIEYDFRANPANGRECWVRSEAYVSSGPEGTPRRLIGLNTDITERKEREQALRRERDRLDEFASVVSHDLRNPLNVAQGRLALAREDCESDHLDAIGRAVDRTIRITEDVLLLAREGPEIESTDPVDVRDVVEATWSMVADDTDRAELRLAGETVSRATIEADADRLRRLLENLFGNAIEHGGEDVTVTVGTLADGFYVEDDGPGIPDDDREDVFVSGYSTDDWGTGFGLGIVDRIAEAHGWNVRATDGSNGGARFEITGVEFVDG